MSGALTEGNLKKAFLRCTRNVFNRWGNTNPKHSKNVAAASQCFEEAQNAGHKNVQDCMRSLFGIQ